ncbi:hypothetical protein K439DRAFT_1615994 [Ramaria rubella]|nr:hypothetical protein K439DRAFT_1615994 [Ramaria rubella]
MEDVNLELRFLWNLFQGGKPVWEVLGMYEMESEDLEVMVNRMYRLLLVFPIIGNTEDDDENFTRAINDNHLVQDSEEEEEERPSAGQSRQGKAKVHKLELHHQRDEQIHVSEMEAKIAALMRELVALQNEEPPDSGLEVVATKPKKSKASTGEGTSDAQVEAKVVDKIRQLGGKFVIMYMLWITNTQASFQMMLNHDYSPLDRFRPSIEWKRQGKQADLCEVLPTEVREGFKDDFIHPIFNTGMNSKRSNSSSRIRTRLRSRIFGYSPDNFVKPRWRYDNCRHLVGRKENADGTVFYMPFSPILYPFLNQSLFDIFNVIIHGPTSLDHNPSLKSGGPVTMDIIWDLKEVTPGAIAASAIFAHYALSNDTVFQRQGNSTKIDY